MPNQLTINYSETPSTTVTDLTNTKWVLDSSLDIYGMVGTGQEIYFNILFNSNGNTYTKLYFWYDIGSDIGDGGVQSQGMSFDTSLDGVIVYNGHTDVWTNQAYRLIEITGGTDVTNTTLIEWLEANAAMTPIINFSNTLWCFNDAPILSNVGTFDLDFTSNNTDYTSLTVTAERMKYGDDLAYGVYQQLATPVCSLSGDTLSWSAISNAASYTLYVDSAVTQTGITALTFDLSTLSSLSSIAHTIQLKAIGAAYYADSALSNSVSYTPAPQFTSTQIEITERTFSGVASRYYARLYYSLDNGSTWTTLSSISGPGNTGTPKNRTYTSTITHNGNPIIFKGEVNSSNYAWVYVGSQSGAGNYLSVTNGSTTSSTYYLDSTPKIYASLRVA